MKLVIDLPDSADIGEEEAKRIIAAKLFEIGRLTLGQAAEVAGCNKKTFKEILEKYNIPVFNFDNPEA